MKKLIAALLALTCTAGALSLASCQKEDRGTLSVETVYAWLGYPAAHFFPVFSNEAYKEELSYEYDTTALTIDTQTNTVTPLKAGVFDVVASSKHFRTTFQVRVEAVDTQSFRFSAANFESAAQNRKTQWEERGNEGKTTVFIGDSFFDTGFWSNFYTASYPGKDALCLGIGSTTTYDWETWINGWFGEITPKNIVMHIGTNNVYDDGDDMHQALSAYQRMFTLMHQKFPDTHIYWFGVSQRAYDEDKIATVAEINLHMQKWCDALPFITYIDTPAKLTKDMLKDTVHPKLEYYSVFVGALSGTDISIRNTLAGNNGDKITDVTFQQTHTISSGSGLANVSYKGQLLSKNYILTGKLDITKKTTNSHVQFGILDSGENRILLWDHASNGQFKLCIPYDTNVPAEDIYTLKDSKTLTIDWKIVHHNNNVYFFIGEELKLVFAAVGNSNAALTLGSEGTAASFYSMRAVTLTDNPAEYQQNIDSMQAVIDTYKNITTFQKIRV